MDEKAQFIGLRQFFGERLAFETARAQIFALKSLFVGDGHLAGQNAAAQRHAGDDADICLVRQRKDFFRRLLGQQVVFDLYGFGPAVFDRGDASSMVLIDTP